MEIVDIGVNYYKSGEKFHGVLERAATKGITRIIIIGVDVETSTAAMRICENEDFRKYGVKLYFTAGLHPQNAHTWGTKTNADLRRLLKHQACVAVGEVGLSFIDGCKAPKEVQRWVFERQAKLAVEFKLPLYLHKRGDNGNELLSIVRSYPSLRDRCLLHCYDGVGDIQPFVDFGFYFGVSGTVAMLRGGDLRRQLSNGSLPLHKVLLETDAPFLLPENWDPVVPGGGSEPCMLPKLSSYIESILSDSDCNRNLTKLCSSTAIDFFALDAIKSNKPKTAPPMDTPNHQLNPYYQNFSGDSGDTLRFLVPDNFRRLGRALRGCGIDCEIVRTNEQIKLAEKAREDNRILLLRHDKSIRGSSNLPRYFKFTDDHIAGQLFEVVHEFGVKLTADDVMQNRRCTTCNAFSWELGTATSGWKKDVLDPHPHAEVKTNCKCKSCGKIYWPWTVPQLQKHTEHFLRFLYQNSNEDVEMFEGKDAYTLIRNCTLQWRATCQYFNGNPNSCKNGFKCPHRHSRHVMGGNKRDLVCVYVYHARYGILLSANEHQGARWMVPWTFFYDDDSKERAIEILNTEFGLEVNSDQVFEAKNRSDGSDITSGRRIYYEYHIQDWQQGVRGDDGVRPSETGEDFWLPAIRSFCFQKDLSLAARIIKSCGHGSTAKADVEGAIAIKKFSDADLFSSKNRTPTPHSNLSDSASLQMKTFQKKNLFLLKSQILTNKHKHNLFKLREKLGKTQGLKAPSVQRALWEARKSCFASCTDADKPKSFKIEESINTDIQTKIIDDHVDGKLASVEATQARAETIRLSVQGAVAEVFPEVETIVYGSTSLGICGPFSDVDICLKLPQFNTLGIDTPADQEGRNNECDTLQSLREKLCTVLMDITPVFKARVPILKCVALPPSNVPVDITLRHIGHKNTKIVLEYFNEHPWLKRLCILVKDWSLWAGVRAPVEPMLSSYALTLMAIYCFSKKGMLKGGRDPPSKSADIMAVFLSYYSWEHNWSKYAICILDTTMTLSELESQTGWDTKPVSGIRDPVELHRNILKPTTQQQLDDIKRRFRLSLTMLCSGKLAEEIHTNT